MRQNRLGGLTSKREPEKSQKVSESHRNDVSPLTQGLRYRAACDLTLSILIIDKKAQVMLHGVPARRKNDEKNSSISKL